MIDKLPTILIAIVFVAPGFIWNAVMSLFVTQKTADKSELLLRYLVLSCGNLALWSPLTLWALAKPWSLTHQVILIFFSLIISPLSLGALAGWAAKRESHNKILAALGLGNTIRAEPTAWDFCFGNWQTGTFVLVRLKDGNLVYGKIGKNSRASSTQDKNDLFISEQWSLNASKNVWIPVEHSAGVYINSGEISTVEFTRIIKPAETSNV